MRRLNETITISPQIQTGDLAGLKAQGVDGVVCARPDGEAPNQPSAEELRAAAEEAGLGFLHVPVTPGHIPSREDADAWSEFVRGKTVHAFCAQGPRAVLLASLAGAADGRTLSAIKAEAAQLGIDLTPIESVLLDRGATTSDSD
ncbi:TIGR01244 family sulfur transferase [Parvularcula maris]|uniref:TIGR01244 family sulfur transferase n=1 Tax=Parvularcula maris TaxID=2965077 RepID=A0A9X2RKC8_9PROT|nr:TIGR01244 family sulfur transferase [Parvularcula maris]MCQ8185643.1 TIGR01244 family sulfur transferase [Parvularcula maris]